MLEVRRFNHMKDVAQMNSWYDGRAMSRVHASELPTIGYIVDNMACGFLYTADGGLGLIEGIITADQIKYADRQLALDLVTAALIDEAKRIGLRKILSLTTSQSIFVRAQRMGFQDLGDFRVMIKNDVQQWGNPSLVPPNNADELAASKVISIGSAKKDT